MELIIIGAGGHGKVVLDVLRAAGLYKPVGFVDADTSLAGTEVGGLPVVGPVNTLPRLRQQRVKRAIIAIGDNRTRVRYAVLLREQGFELVNAIHPAASVSSSAVLGVNVVIAAQAAVCTEARLADSVIINTGALVDHECVIAEGVHVAPGVCLAGRVRVGTCAFVGIGANLIQCLSVGEHATIGAGAAVIEDIPAYATAVGVPARVIKTGGPDKQENGTT
ncbi:MAG: sugar O-acyltransferase, sialic acid O-acetyltransferase NeuD family [Phycisphaerales bacterium]|nr:sugar O-acyltransferase, sialic acid O-acetyltransferase NeuD family [Phycisphaerales bacterium]